MNVKQTGTLIATILLGAFLAGCCGGGTTVQPTPVAGGPSIGQQLTELKKAYDSGAISEKEYNKLKEEAIQKSSK